jgi:hypothetical protein
MASGDTLRVFHPLASEMPVGTFAYIRFTSTNARPYLSFDENTDKEAVWTSVFPRHYNGNGITVNIHMMSENVNSGNVVWQGAFERQLDGSDYVHIDSFAAFQSSGSGAVPGLTRQTAVMSISFANSELDGCVAGEMFRFKLRRDADNAQDTAAGEVGVMLVELRES